METTYWNLKTELFHLERQTGQLKQEVSQAKYDLREAKAKQLEYSGSFRSFLDKLSGKQEQQLNALRSAQTRAETRLTERGRELGDASQKLETSRALLDTLSPTPDPKGEARYCIECLTVMLPEADEALTNMGEWMRGAVPGRIATQADRQRIYGEAEQLAASCAELLKQLEAALGALGIPFDFPSCFRDPIAYLANATEYTRRDRLNELVSQTIRLGKQFPDLRRQI